MDVDELVAEFRPRVRRALIATDFDGTLAPLTRDPEDSRAAAGAVESLVALARDGARVAVITGRDARTVVRLGGLEGVPGLTVAGMYGIETWAAGELTTPEMPPEIVALRERLPGVLAGGHPDLWIEDKRLSLVVHARRADDPDLALAGVRDGVHALAEELALEVHPGSQVLELRLPGFDKAAALARFAEGASAVLYLGDDLGDLPAFAEIGRLRKAGTPAWSVGVLSSGASGIADAVDVTLADPAEAVSFLGALASGG